MHNIVAVCHAYELKVVHCYRADIIMPCVHKRKTSRGLAPSGSWASRQGSERREEVHSSSIKGWTNKLNGTEDVQYMNKKENKHVRRRGNDTVAEAHKVFSDYMEAELANYIQNLVDQFHGLSSLKCRELVYELAHWNNIPVPDNWSRSGRVSDI